MPVEVLHVGFGNVVASGRVVCVIKAGSSPVRRLMDQAEQDRRLIDATSGRRTRSVIVTDSNHVILSHINPVTLVGKLQGIDVEEGEMT